MAPAAWLLPLLASISVAGLPGLPVPPPPPPAPPTGRQAAAAQQAATRSGNRISLNGQMQQARWELSGNAATPRALWLPLEVLQNQLGVSSRAATDGTLRLEWFGQEQEVPAAAQRSLDDEVAVEVASLLGAAAVASAVDGGVLKLELPPPALLAVRSSTAANRRRVVLDLGGAALVRRDGGEIWLALQSDPAQRRQLRELGLQARTTPAGLRLQDEGSGQRVFSLGEPPRIVIDRQLSTPSGSAGSADGGDGTEPTDPRLLALIGQEILWDRQVHGSVRLNAVRLDPRNRSLTLRPLTGAGSMQGLNSLQQLAAKDDALVAINGGYFNRVKRLPLGAVKVDGRWFSGPILGRGVVAWAPGSMPRFGRLSLQEWVADRQGVRRPLVVLNSGYVQRGISRYTAEWGPSYRALSGQERALLLRNATVQELYDSAALEQGVPLRPGDTLLVARGGMELPWSAGDVLSISSEGQNPLAQAPFVVGGGPLLLQNGRIVLNGSLEQFSSAFQRQGAPRTVIASDDRQLWLITLEGNGTPGPTLSETATLLKQLGLRDALNLDGGSSTGLVMGGVMTVKGRGVAGSVHHGLGLVPSARPTTARVRSASATAP